MSKTGDIGFNNNAFKCDSTDNNPENCKQVESDDNLKKRKISDGFKQVFDIEPHVLIISLVGVIGFCFHFYMTLHQYLEYKTTVSFSNEYPKDFRYPSTTLCFPDVVPYYKLAQEYPEYSENVNQIYAEMKSRNDSNFWRGEETKQFLNISGYDSTAYYMHEFYQKKLFQKKNILDILKDYSHSEHEKCLLDSQPLSKNDDKMESCENVSQPIQSINSEFRCFTYFLQLKHDISAEFDNILTTSIVSTSDKHINDLYELYYALNKSTLSHPFDKDFYALISIHPSNMIPVDEFYPNILLYQKDSLYSRYYKITFQKTISHLLETPYQTKCFNYSLNDQEGIQSYDDCVTKCIMVRYRQNCQCLPLKGLLYRKSLLTPEDRFCAPDNKCQRINYRTECSTECQPDCIEEKYDFDKFADFNRSMNMTKIVIHRKPVPDKVYRHSPAMTLTDLFCNFGGLGGLWLGFSVITIISSIISFITKSGKFKKHKNAKTECQVCKCACRIEERN